MTPRLYVKDTLQSGNKLQLDEAKLHYLKNVLRLPQGAQLRLFNGIDGEYAAHIGMYHKKFVEIICEEHTREQRNPQKIGLMFALIKPARQEFLIEKATELGASDIYPLVTDHCTYRKINTNKLATYTTEAAEQCERLTVPVIHGLMSLQEGVLSYEGKILWADESRDTTETLREVLEKHDISSVLIGPEGGFSEKEKTFLRSQDHVYPVHLGELILRAETAGIALLSAYQAHSGAWR
jgi:16S rRNA (uracil1498-N3)-methyltransferase